MNPAAFTLHDAGEKLRKQELSAQELTLAAFQRIGETDDGLGIFKFKYKRPLLSLGTTWKFNGSVSMSSLKLFDSKNDFNRLT